MFNVTRTGSPAEMAVDIRSLVTTQVPLIVAKALTFTAQSAQKDVVTRMEAVFKGGATRYTRNSTRVVPATPAALAARLAVKDETTNNGNIPEDYLLPEVVGGPRKEKRFERAMRYAGLLQGRERAVLGEYAPVDSFGNLRVGEIQRILTATRSAFDPYQRKSNSARSRRNARKAPYFAARIGRTWGVWKRDGKRDVVPILIFITKPPRYRPVLDFEAVAAETARRTRAVYHSVLSS